MPELLLDREASHVLTLGRLSWLYALAPLAALGSAGCQDSETGRSSAAQIGPEGGILRVQGATLRIPEGALGYQLRVEMAELGTKSVVPPVTTQLAGPAFVLRPHGTRFDMAASLTLPYRASEEDLVYAARLDNEHDRTWTFLRGTGRFQNDREATIEIDGFSVYAVVKTRLPVDFGGGGSGGGSTGEGGAQGQLGEYSYERYCERTCSARAELECPSDRSEELCTTRCIGGPPDETGACYQQLVALNECVWEIVPSAYECGNDGKSAVKNEVCAAEQADIVDCQGL